MNRPKVVLVGGLEWNVPSELRERVEIVKHVEQTNSFRVGNLPAADYIFVISDFASHTLVDVVRQQLNVPIVWLKKGWSSMRQELEKRSILPPDSGPRARVAEAAPQETPTTTGLPEEELWKLYRTKLVEAAKAALKPRELVSEDDLCEILGDLAGIPKEDVRILLPRFQVAGTLSLLENGLWTIMIDDDGYEVDLESPDTQKRTRRRIQSVLPENKDGRAERGYERAKKISGLLMGPYPSFVALCREMQKYKEFENEDGKPLSIGACRNLIDRAIELKIVDDTHEKIFVDYKSETVLTRTAPPEPEPEPKPIPQPKLSEEGKVEKVIEERKAEIRKELTKEEAEKAWCYVVGEVKRMKRHIGTILENGRIEWLAESAILVFLIPPEFSVYRGQLESTENWGLISDQARQRFGQSVVIRFVLDNGAKKGKV